jgi:ABC-type Fe3+-hydroxamate transport system substrate-binding protein
MAGAPVGLYRGASSVNDDLGHPVPRGGPARRVVSLVPSLTEAIAETRAAALVGATDWCTHPADLDVTRVRGTKNPDRQTIIELAPDLVIANREENRELDITRLRDAGIAVWVTVIETVDQAFASMRRMFTDALGWDVPQWLVDAERVWERPTMDDGRRVAVPIWRDPWMVVGSQTFTGDLIERLGLVNAFGDSPDRYPHVELADIHADLVLLPDEPYVFTTDDGPEAFRDVSTVLVSGRSLTWYGPSMLTARQELEALLTLPPSAATHP